MAFNISVTYLQDIDMNNSNVLNFFWNYFNSIFHNIQEKSLNIKTSIYNKIDAFDWIIVVLFIINFVCSLIFLLAFSCILINIKNEKDTILFLFLDIKQSYVNLFYGKCEKFLSSYVVIIILNKFKTNFSCK